MSEFPPYPFRCTKHGLLGCGCSSPIYQLTWHDLTSAQRQERERCAQVPHKLNRCTCPAEPNIVRGRDKPHADYCPIGIRDAIRALPDTGEQRE